MAQSNLAFLFDQHHHKAGGALSAGERVLGMDSETLAKRAMQMYGKAAQQGNVDAELKLGDYHFYGHGTPVDYAASVGRYRSASDSRSAQGMFNLAYMYAHGLGPTRDYHLAKRHYDMAGEAAAEAWAPVQLALLELRALQACERYFGSGAVGPYEWARTALTPLRAPAEAIARVAVEEWDTVAIVVLCVALGLVLFQRQRQQNNL